MKIYSLKEHFELRNTRSLNPREGLGRFFTHCGKPGFSDGSGAVWPVVIEQNTQPQTLVEGCIYRFRVAGLWSCETRLSKYRDNETFLHFSELKLEAGRSDTEEAWELFGIPDPRRAPDIPTTMKSDAATFFLASPTSQRLRVLSQRSEALKKTREYFVHRRYVELDPPQLVLSGSLERYLATFRTVYVDHRGQSWSMELPTSPELSLKKIVTEGIHRVFAMSHSFRNNGELSKHHDPEFMMLEWYRVGGTLADLMSETQAMVEVLASNLCGPTVLPRGAWPVFKVSDLFQKILNIDLNENNDTMTFRERSAKKCSSIVGTDTWDDVFCKLFMEFIEPFLSSQRACFVSHYPQQMSTLAAKCPINKECAERFELFINGVEICNGYRELLDVSDFNSRLTLVTGERKDVATDPLFDSAMSAGLYPCVGNAVGLDRLICVLKGEETLQHILPWPFFSRFRKQTVALE